MSVPNYYEILNKAKEQKRVFIGPFYGEFGHLLIHVLPFLGYLHKHGVQIQFCGHAGQQSLLVDENKQPIFLEYAELPPHFDVSVPEMNDPRHVKDEKVLKMANEWVERAESSGLPFFNLSDPHNYRQVWWPWWYNNRFGHLYNLKHAYNPDGIQEHAVALYSRTKPLGTAQGTGKQFYMSKIVDCIADHIDKIYIVGHPDQAHVVEHPKVENIVTNNNADILRSVSKCKVILSHNSGAAYIAKIMRIPGLVFHNGDLKRFKWTEYCSCRWSKSPLVRAQSYTQIENKLQELLS